MIKKMAVGSFKSLKDVEVELGLFNIFIGANGSGKSNLLEAVGILSAAAFGRVDDESLLRRGVRAGIPRLYKSAFPKTGTDKPYIFFRADNAGAGYEVSLANPESSLEPNWRFKSELLRTRNERYIVNRVERRGAPPLNPEQGLAALKSVDLSVGDPARQLLETLRGYSIFCPNTPTLRHSECAKQETHSAKDATIQITLRARD